MTWYTVENKQGTIMAILLPRCALLDHHLDGVWLQLLFLTLTCGTEDQWCGRRGDCPH